MTRAEIEGLIAKVAAEPVIDAGEGPFVELWEADRDALLTALRAMLAREEAMREALAEINRRASPHPDRTLGECADELVRIAAVARYHLAQGAPDHA